MKAKELENSKTERLNSEEYVFAPHSGAPVAMHGLLTGEDGVPVRVPAAVREAVSESVMDLGAHSAGGRLRFKTDSGSIAIRVWLQKEFSMPHMPLSGISGCSVYERDDAGEWRFRGAVLPGPGAKYEGAVGLSGALRDVCVYLPLYNGFTKIAVGFRPESEVRTPSEYRFSRPFVTYGSSITQGGCASRPGNSYQGHLSRWLDSDYINLGFSGSARGEPAMAEYIAGLDMSAFVLDYDHNAPDPGHLAKTHEPFFRAVRSKNPGLPVIFVSKPDFDNNPADGAARREIIRRTYESAVRAGDRQVWFVDGEGLFGTEDRWACTVDTVHPNDLGFYRMAKGIYPALREALGAE